MSRSRPRNSLHSPESSDSGSTVMTVLASSGRSSPSLAAILGARFAMSRPEQASCRAHVEWQEV